MRRTSHPLPIAVVSLLGMTSSIAIAQAQETGASVTLPEIVVQTTPVPGAVGINADKIPALVTSVPAKDFEERRSPTVTDTITSHVPAAISLNVDGSDLSPDLYYRGFAVSRISGVAQGLAVYQNGVRINEAFGDSVNLDLVPPIAVDHADIYTNNPIFGLNALGGAIAFTMKNGFNFHGGDATILGGSYGRVNGFMEYGKQVGNYSFYVAADGYRDGGYRPFGAQNAQRAYADLGYRSQDSEVHLIGSYGRSLLGVQGVTPVPLVQNQYNSVFTTPQTTENRPASLSSPADSKSRRTGRSIRTSTSASSTNTMSTATMPTWRIAAASWPERSASRRRRLPKTPRACSASSSTGTAIPFPSRTSQPTARRRAPAHIRSPSAPSSKRRTATRSSVTTITSSSAAASTRVRRTSRRRHPWASSTASSRTWNTAFRVQANCCSRAAISASRRSSWLHGPRITGFSHSTRSTSRSSSP